MSIQSDYEADYIKNGVFNEYKENGEWDQTMIKNYHTPWCNICDRPVEYCRCEKNK